MFSKKGIFCLIVVLLATMCVCADQTESEPNDSSSSADGPINFNETLTGGLPGSYGGDSSSPQDWWSFSAVAGRTYTFNAQATNCSSAMLGGLDLALDIENSSGSVVAQEDSGFDCDSETIVWNCSSSGTYYLVVWEATSTPDGISGYTVSCQEDASVDDWELY